MIAIIEHKNGDRRSVRDDFAAEYVACVNCKGMGARMLCDGQMGHLWYHGWQINSYSQYSCRRCDGLGIWREAPTLPSPHGEGGQNIAPFDDAEFGMKP